MPDLVAGRKLHGFSIVSVNEIPEYRSKGILLHHLSTGCRVYHLVNDDPENVFAFVFKTLPHDNTGSAHIVEHAVLSGSKRFPVKDPFVSLLKGSMHTYLNALTYPDKTAFPAGSTVEKDLFNLLYVYGDAVFFPLLKKEVFHQEGRRFEIREDGSLKVTGVVFNEMSGNYSNHESILGEWALRSLFPDTAYRFDSGGEPFTILDLKYEDFIGFHGTYYHPSNCYIYLYGNIPTEKYLHFLESNFLSSFSKIEIDASIPLQKRWKEPRRFEVTSPLGDGEVPSGKTSIAVSWLLPEVTDPFKVLCMEILDQILIGNAGSPLRKAIVDSGLGEDLSPLSGLDKDILEMVYIVGLRGTDPQKQDDFEALVQRVLYDISEKGIQESVIRGAVKRVEFENREIKGGIPFGLRLMAKVLRGWIHGETPERSLEFERWIRKVQQAIQEDKAFFEGLIRETLLTNVHRAIVVVRPDPRHEELEKTRIKEKLNCIRQGLQAKALRRIKHDLKLLKRFQERKDSPADIRIPFLHLEDVPKEVEKIPFEKHYLDGVPIFCHDVFTNGVVYLDFALDCSGLEEKAAVFLPLYAKAVCKGGLPGIPYDEVAQQLALKTGGFTSFPEAGALPTDPPRFKEFLFFRLKVLENDVPEAIELAVNLMLSSDFTDIKRLQDLIFELRNDFKAAIIPGGNSFVSLRASGRLAKPIAREEIWRGIAQFLFLESLARFIPEGLKDIGNILNSIRSMIFRKAALCVNMTSGKAVVPKIINALSKEIPRFPEKADPVDTSGIQRLPDSLWVMTDKTEVKKESITVPSAVGFVGLALPASILGTACHSREVILAHLLSTGYLWEHIRMKGGAYGVSAVPNGNEGVFVFSSYRDPDIARTVETFRAALRYFADNQAEAESIEKAIIGSVGKEIRPMAPGTRGFVGFRRNLCGITDDIRQRKRDTMLKVDRLDISGAAEALCNSSEKAATVVMGGSDALRPASQSMQGFDSSLSLPL
ncbi:MAG: insulinase family protein [Spirochaetota bacterium]